MLYKFQYAFTLKSLGVPGGFFVDLKLKLDTVIKHDVYLFFYYKVMSSKILHQTDYISVIWESFEIQNMESSKNEDSVSRMVEMEKIEFLKLYIAIQVNWKQKTIETEFEVIKTKGVSLCTRELKSNQSWKMLYNTLEQLGYKLSDEDIWYGIINNWINDLYITY